MTPLAKVIQRTDNPAVVLGITTVLLDAYVDFSGGHPSMALDHQSDNVALVELLLARGADPKETDSYGLTPLHIAARRTNNPRVTAALLYNGADPNTRSVRYSPAAEDDSIPVSSVDVLVKVHARRSQSVVKSADPRSSPPVRVTVMLSESERPYWSDTFA